MTTSTTDAEAIRDALGVLHDDARIDDASIDEAVTAILSYLASRREAQEPEPVAWRDGAPAKPWCDEWFIAETTYGDRVVLRSLPEEYTYDFKTADETYIKSDKIRRWMQFPDSKYIAPPAPAGEVERLVKPIIDRLEWNGRLQQWVVRPDLPAGTINAVRAALNGGRHD